MGKYERKFCYNNISYKGKEGVAVKKSQNDNLKKYLQEDELIRKSISTTQAIFSVKSAITGEQWIKKYMIRFFQRFF